MMRASVKRAATTAVLVFLATMCATVPHARRIPRLDELTLDEKIGQLFVVGAYGVFMNESSPAYARLLHQVRDNHVGGFIWFVSNVYETAALTERLQAESRVPLLISAELVPFRAAIAAGVASIMPGHLSVPALDPTPAPVRAGLSQNPYGTSAAEVTQNGTLPATISNRMLDGLLRRELGFRGLVITDAFDMGGLTEHFDAGEAAVRAIEAGEDQILMSPDVDAAVAALKVAVKSGRVSEARIDESVRRILDAKAFVGSAATPPGELFRTLDAREHRDLAASIARRAITLVREYPGALPMKKDAKV